MKSIISIAALVALSGSAAGQVLEHRTIDVDASQVFTAINPMGETYNHNPMLSVEDATYNAEIAYISGSWLAGTPISAYPGGIPAFTVVDNAAGAGLLPETGDGFNMIINNNANMQLTPTTTPEVSYWNDPANASWAEGVGFGPSADAAASAAFSAANGEEVQSSAFTAQDVTSFPGLIRMSLGVMNDQAELPGFYDTAPTVFAYAGGPEPIFRGGEDLTFGGYQYGPTDRNAVPPTLYMPDLMGFAGDEATANALQDAVGYRMLDIAPPPGEAWDQSVAPVCTAFGVLMRGDTSLVDPLNGAAGGYVYVTYTIGGIVAEDFINDPLNEVLGFDLAGDGDDNIDFALGLTDTSLLAGLQLSDGFNYSLVGFHLALDVALEDGAEPCVGDFADSSGFGPPDGMVDFGDFFALSFLAGPCGAGTANPDCNGDLADSSGFGPPDSQIDFGDFFALSFLAGPCP